MKSFAAKIDNLRKAGDNCRAVENELHRCEESLNGIRCALNFQITSRQQIDRKLSNQQTMLSGVAEKSGQMGTALDSILQKYVANEQKLAGIRPDSLKKGTDDAKPVNLSVSTPKPVDIEPEEDNKYSEYTDFLKHLMNLSRIGKTVADFNGASVEGWGAGNSGASLLFSLVSLFDPKADRSAIGNFKQWLSLGKSEIDFAGKVIEWIDKKFGKSSDSVIEGLKLGGEAVKTSAAIGLLTGVFGAASELANASGKTSAQQLHNSGKLAVAGGKIATSADKLLNAAKYQNLSKAQKLEVKTSTANTVAGAAGALSMVADGAATIYDRYTDDKRFDTNDLGYTCLHTGATGLSTVVSSYTGGIVNLNADRAVEIYTAYANKGAEIISSTNLPTPVQVALVVPGTVVAGALGTVSTVIDYGMQIGEKLKGLFHRR